MTSGAVASVLSNVSSTTIQIQKRVSDGSTMYLYKYGKVVFFILPGDWSQQSSGENLNLGVIPYGYRPKSRVGFREWTNAQITLFCSFNGNISTYNYEGAFNYARNGNYTGCWIMEE